MVASHSLLVAPARWVAYGLAALAALAVLGVGPAMAQTEIGQAATVVADVTGSLEGDDRELAEGDAIFQQETITTGPDSAATLAFQDGSELSMGENAELTLTDVVYDPDSGPGRAVVEFVQGVFGFVSGDMPDESYRVETATATMGIRGTAFAVDTASSGETAVQLIDGQVQVAGRAGGSELLSEPGSATTVAQGAAPTAPSAGAPAGTGLANLGQALGPAQPTQLAQAAQAAGLTGLAGALVPGSDDGDAAEGEDEASAQEAGEEIDIAQDAPLELERNRQPVVDTGSQTDIGANIHLGTLGLGGELEYRPWTFMGFRAGGSYLPINTDTLSQVGVDAEDSLGDILLEQNIENFDLDSGSGVDLITGGAYIDVYPFGRLPLLGNLRLTGGGMYNGNNADISGSGTYTGASVPADADVDMDFQAETPNFAPYAGVGYSMTLFGIGVGADAGAIFQGEPDISLTATCDGVEVDSDTTLPPGIDDSCKQLDDAVTQAENDAQNSIESAFDNNAVLKAYPVVRVMAVLRF